MFRDPYHPRRQELLEDAMSSRALIDVFRRRRPLPRGYGVGFDERVVEYPWLLSKGPSGRALDGGSTLNHPYVLDVFLPLLRSLCIVNMSYEGAAFPERDVSYLFTDLRDLPFRDGWFDTVISISTLEHVGMDNSVYGVAGTRAADPYPELLRATAELRRITAPGGNILITVPFGEPQDLGWLHQFDAEGLERIIEAAAPASSETTIYAYSREGWQLSEAAAAAHLSYYDERECGPDLAVAARAVACLDLQV